MDDVKTTGGERFSYDDTANLAWMVYRRFGRDLYVAHRAWCRLMQIDCTVTDFHRLVDHADLNDEG